MATRAVSPSAALLRTSRMFSLPKPLPPSPGDGPGASFNYSESATTPFPQYQAITTPQSSRSRGDWGLKRPLPLKTTTKTSTPAIRVRQIDAMELVTDFFSAGDHVLSLKKWQALNMPLTAPAQNKVNMKAPAKSVFEEDTDFTAVDPGREAEAKDHRWKFRGPWLAGIPQGSFKKYLQKSVRTRRSEFRQFLRKKLAAELDAVNSRNSMDEGTVADIGLVSPDSITEEELTEYIRRLRYERQKLYDFVGEFLDLAPIKPDDGMALFQDPYRTKRPSVGNPYARDGPPMTHPSAGISYLRTDACLANHPLYGPQKTQPPVKARFVMPRGNSGSKGPKIGIGGFVANAPEGQGMFSGGSGGSNKNNVNRFNPDLVGGAKVHVRLLKATVNSQGRVMLQAGQADPEPVLVAEELEGDAEVYNSQPPAAPAGDAAPWNATDAQPLKRPTLNRILGSKQTYGLNF